MVLPCVSTTCSGRKTIHWFHVFGQQDTADFCRLFWFGSLLQLFNVWCERHWPNSVSGLHPVRHFSELLLRHRDFWQEMPYMLKDVISHLCSSTHPRRSSRGGYVAVWAWCMDAFSFSTFSMMSTCLMKRRIWDTSRTSRLPMLRLFLFRLYDNL